ncbi:MAG TPA: VOC family protein [Rhizomicrobium sp.]|nr:VOC family protein [Rhizomicrobium sp.]
MSDRAVFIPSVIYKDQRAALAWLEKAFGFEPSMVLVNGAGEIAHAEMSYGDGVIMVGSEWPAWKDWCKSPISAGGANTQRLHVRVERDIDKHCERARAAGAVIAAEPADQFYGDRTYMAVDPEGHHWSFAQTVAEPSLEDQEKKTGLKYQTLK